MKTNENFLKDNEFFRTPDNDIINDNNLDEMQKSETYRIAFGIYHYSYWIMIVLALAMVSAGGITSSTITAVFGIILHILNCAMYLVYAAGTSSKGIMNQKFASRAGKKENFIGYITLGILYFCLFKDNYFYINMYIAVFYISVGIASLFAIRNNRIVQKACCED